MDLDQRDEYEYVGGRSEEIEEGAQKKFTLYSIEIRGHQIS